MIFGYNYFSGRKRREPYYIYIYSKYLVVFAGEELNSHDGEYEPEDEAHQQHVEDGGDGLHQSVHHHLDTRVRFLYIIKWHSARNIGLIQIHAASRQGSFYVYVLQNFICKCTK
jgi:hypothetical protein